MKLTIHTYPWLTIHAQALLDVAEAARGFCDGSHEGTEFLPVKIQLEKPETFVLCQCKQTGDAPRCDGTHSRL